MLPVFLRDKSAGQIKQATMEPLEQGNHYFHFAFQQHKLVQIQFLF